MPVQSTWREQNKKRKEDAIVYPPRPKREVIKMAERKRDERRQRRMNKEEEERKKQRNHLKLVNRKLHNEVKEVEEWNLQRELIAKSIDSKYEKGKCGCGYGALFDIVCYRDVFLIFSSKFMVEGVSPHQLWRCLSCR